MLKSVIIFISYAERVVPKILGQLCSGNLSPTQHLETQQALVKQLAEILEFVLKFDEHKMKTPAIQNDFSYYRRTLTRASLVRQDNAEKDLIVGNELANRMSLFYAHATPMLRVLSHATITFLIDVSAIFSLLFPSARPSIIDQTIIDPARCWQLDEILRLSRRFLGLSLNPIDWRTKCISYNLIFVKLVSSQLNDIILLD